MATDSDFRYADRTSVPAHQTIGEIQRMLGRFRASRFLEYTDRDRGFTAIGFQSAPDESGEGRAYVMYVPLPDPKQFPESRPPKVDKGGGKSFASAFEQERARLLRVVAGLVKMKLVAATEGVTTVEKEFFGDLVVWNADGRQQTVYEWYAPQVEHLRKEGLQPPVLPALAEPQRIAGRIPRLTLEAKP